MVKERERVAWTILIRTRFRRLAPLDSLTQAHRFVALNQDPHTRSPQSTSTHAPPLIHSHALICYPPSSTICNQHIYTHTPRPVRPANLHTQLPPPPPHTQSHLCDTTHTPFLALFYTHACPMCVLLCPIMRSQKSRRRQQQCGRRSRRRARGERPPKGGQGKMVPP